MYTMLCDDKVPNFPGTGAERVSLKHSSWIATVRFAPSR